MAIVFKCVIFTICVDLFFFLSGCLPVSLFFFSPLCLCVYQSSCLSLSCNLFSLSVWFLCLSIFPWLSVCLSLSLYLCLPASVSVCLSLSLSVSLCLSLFLSLSLYPPPPPPPFLPPSNNSIIHLCIDSLAKLIYMAFESLSDKEVNLLQSICHIKKNVVTFKPQQNKIKQQMAKKKIFHTHIHVYIVICLYARKMLRT